ncbi:MAG TPA: nucleotide sugar dehydrogenase [bacterium]|nr:nucleotide sugar dehydrogenase [bacterium]
MKITYSVVGLGKLGASLAAVIASRGFRAIGVDINQAAVDAVNAGHAPVQETALEELIAANRRRLSATMSHREAVLESDVTFVIVPTPSDERGAFSLQYAAWAFREIGRALAEKHGYHNVVLTSTVLPGSTRFGLLPILERESGKICGKDFGVCYSPEFIALGSIIHDLLNPDFVLIGESDERAGGQLEGCYMNFVENHAPCVRMSLENAELTKIAVNAFITTKITFANMLASLCERLPGGDVDVVANALGLDSRIGRKYLTGALGYGGPCFPRDNRALSFIAQALGQRADLAETTDAMNRDVADKIVEGLRPLIGRGTTVAVLGLAYKPLTHVIEESQGIYLCKALSSAGARVIAYDPLAGVPARLELRDRAVVLDSISECLAQAEVVVIATPDPAFHAVKAAEFNNRLAPVTVIDCWRTLKEELSGHSGVRYLPVGQSTDDDIWAEKLAGLWNLASQPGE